MAGLTWSGDDGFDAAGARVAGVLRGFDDLAFGAAQGGHGAGFFAPRTFWEAYVVQDGRFEPVMVGGRPGQWDDADDARAAATSAYETLLAEAPARVAGTTVTADARADGPRTGSRLERAWSYVRILFPGRTRSGR